MNITQNVVSERDRALVGGDYAQYHAQTVRKIHTLRRRLGTATPRGRKYTPKAPVTAENVAQNPEWVQLLLASSERAWAHAMTMKSLQSPENTQKQMPGSTKRQIASRYRRAVVYATNLATVLEDQSTSKAATSDALEAKAYLALLKGGLDFEKGRWQSCIQNYAVARLVYAALASTTKSDVYKEILDNTVDPSIRYAAYQSKLPRTKTVQDIAIEAFPNTDRELRSSIITLDSQSFTTTSEKSREKKDGITNLPTSLSWRTRNVKIEDASVSEALGIALSQESDLQGSQIVKNQTGQSNSKDLASAFEDVINARQEVVDTTKNAIEELRNQGVDQGDSRFQSLQVIRTAVNYAVIEWQVGRNRVLCGSDDGLIFESQAKKQGSKPTEDGKQKSLRVESSGKQLARLRERVALYDSILQSIDSVKELPGVVADSAFVEELDGKKAYFRALKCLSIGRSHSLNGNILDSLALFAKASELAQKAQSTLSKSPSSTPSDADTTLVKLSVTSTQLSNLTNHLTSLVLHHRGLADLRNIVDKDATSAATKSSSISPPLIESLHLSTYTPNIDLTNLVNYPPKIRPVPVKPLFFDLAWNYIQYPSQGKSANKSSNGDVALPNVAAAASAATEAVSNATAAVQEKVAKKGWFSFGRS